MYLHQTLPQACKCPLLTLYMSSGERAIRSIYRKSLPTALVFCSGDPWLWGWILSCTHEVTVSVLICLRIPITTVSSSTPPPILSILTITIQRKGGQKIKVLKLRLLEMFFSYYHAIWQFYNFTVSWLFRCHFPGTMYFGFSFCGFFVCLFLGTRPLYIALAVTELTI